MTTTQPVYLPDASDVATTIMYPGRPPTHVMTDNEYTTEMNKIISEINTRSHAQLSYMYYTRKKGVDDSKIIIELRSKGYKLMMNMMNESYDEIFIIWGPDHPMGCFKCLCCECCCGVMPLLRES
jgi:hypothetical protein